MCPLLPVLSRSSCISVLGMLFMSTSFFWQLQYVVLSDIGSPQKAFNIFLWLSSFLSPNPSLIISDQVFCWPEPVCWPPFWHGFMPMSASGRSSLLKVPSKSHFPTFSARGLKLASLEFPFPLFDPFIHLCSHFNKESDCVFCAYFSCYLTQGCSTSVLLFLKFVCSAVFPSLGRKEADISNAPSTWRPLPAGIMPIWQQ